MLKSDLVRWSTIKAPIATSTVRSSTVIPNEQGWKSIPTATTPSTSQWQTNADLPWTSNWSFENGTTSWAPGASTHTTHYCGSAASGNCYAWIGPNSSGLNSTSLRQTFLIPSWTSANGQVLSGSNTDYDVIGRFRCPVWSPNYYKGQPGTAGASSCQVRIGFRSLNTSVIHWSSVQAIPNVWSWYFKKTYVDFDWPPHSSDDEIEIIIDTMGYGVDVDGVWVQSGL